MYHFKNRVTNSNPEIADKANFIVDYFEFCALDLGKSGGFEIDNHRSICDKIITQLENHTKYSKKYINQYFKGPYFSDDDMLVIEHYASDIKELRAAEKDYNVTKAPAYLLRLIKAYQKKLDHTLFRNALDGLISALLCEQPLSQHNHVKIFEYCIGILITEFVFAGFDPKNLPYLLVTIFEREVVLKDNRVKTNAPLPTELLTLKDNPEQFYNAAQEYLNNRSLRQQFEGIFFSF